MSREQKVAAVEAYLDCFATKDLSKVPFAEDVTFEGPSMPKLTGIRPSEIRHDTRILLPPPIPSLDPFFELREMFRVRHEVNRRLRFPGGYSP